MITRKTPATSKPDPDAIDNLILLADLEGDLTYRETPRTLKFFRRYNGDTASYSISRNEARMWLVNAMPAQCLGYDEVAAVL